MTKIKIKDDGAKPKATPSEPLNGRDTPVEWTRSPEKPIPKTVGRAHPKTKR